MAEISKETSGVREEDSRREIPVDIGLGDSVVSSATIGSRKARFISTVAVRTQRPSDLTVSQIPGVGSKKRKRQEVVERLGLAVPRIRGLLALVEGIYPVLVTAIIL